MGGMRREFAHGGGWWWGGWGWSQVGITVLEVEERRSRGEKKKHQPSVSP